MKQMKPDGIEPAPLQLKPTQGKSVKVDLVKNMEAAFPGVEEKRSAPASSAIERSGTWSKRCSGARIEIS